MTALVPSGPSLFSSVVVPSGVRVNTFPCQAKSWTNLANMRVRNVPVVQMASPAAFPSGMGPATLERNRASSSLSDFPSSSFRFIYGFGSDVLEVRGLGPGGG